MTMSVYWIHAKEHTDITSQGYIGVTINTQRRLLEHSKRKSNRHLTFAIEKYGWDNLVKDILVVAEKDYCLDVEKQLRPIDGIGWNTIAGGGLPPVLFGSRPELCGRTPWNKGKKLSEETRKKISEAVKKQMADPEHRKLLSVLKKGKPSNRAGKKHSPETIEKMRAAKLGKKHSVETRAKMRASYINRTNEKEMI